jgi:hypothetical protein
VTLRILLWHVHGSWTNAFVRGHHEYLLPTVPDGKPWGGGRGDRNWPSTREVLFSDLADADVDVVLLQRPEEFRLAESWLGGRRLGHDVPAVYVEHDPPRGRVPDARHPLADLAPAGEVPLVHVTHFNELIWDAAHLQTRVIEHGVVDPGYRYTGELGRAATVVDEPARPGRAAGTDLLPAMARAVPIDVYGIRPRQLELSAPAGRITVHEELPPELLHTELAARRCYLHLARWTSPGTTLIEAMHLGLPVVALATTGVLRAVPSGAGVLSADVAELAAAAADMVADPGRAKEMGLRARDAALRRYGLHRFLTDWDELLSTLV